jgi:hypothetical protein
MTKKIYTLEEFKQGKLAIHCKDERAYNKLMQRLEKAGFKVYRGKPTEWNIFDKHLKETCINFENKDKTLEFCDKEYYKTRANKYTIIKPHEINLIEEPKARITVTKNIAPTTMHAIQNETGEITIHTPFFETEEQIQGGWTQEMIDEAKKNPQKYGLEPTAELTIASNQVFSDDVIVDLDHKQFTDKTKVIIKYQGKEIVITREDFEGEIKLKCNDEAYSTSGRTFFGGKEDLGYAKGSRAWALLALDRGEKIRHNTWDKDEYIYLFDSTNSSQLLCEDDNFPEELYFHKDGWELYEEKVKPKTMTFAKMLETEGNCKFKFGGEDDEINVCGIWERDCGEVLLKKEGEETVKMNLAYIAKLGRKEVEIIEEKVCTN